MKKSCKTMAFPLLAGLLAAPALALDTVDVTLTGFGLGKHTSVSSNSGGSFRNTWAGFTSATFVNSTSTDVRDGAYELFCLQLLQSIGFGSSNQFTIQPVLAGNIPDGPPGPLSAVAAAGVENMFSEADGFQYQSSADAAAFQLALWDITFDYDGTLASLDLGAGIFRASTTPAVTGLFNTYAASVVNGSTLLGDTTYGLQNIKVQDLALFIPGDRDIPCVNCDLPEPGSLAMLGIGMLGLGTRRYALALK